MSNEALYPVPPTFSMRTLRRRNTTYIVNHWRIQRHFGASKPVSSLTRSKLGMGERFIHWPRTLVRRWKTERLSQLYHRHLPAPAEQTAIGGGRRSRRELPYYLSNAKGRGLSSRNVMRSRGRAGFYLHLYAHGARSGLCDAGLHADRAIHSVVFEGSPQRHLKIESTTLVVEWSSLTKVYEAARRFP